MYCKCSGKVDNNCPVGIVAVGADADGIIPGVRNREITIADNGQAGRGGDADPVLMQEIAALQAKGQIAAVPELEDRLADAPDAYIAECEFRPGVVRDADNHIHGLFRMPNQGETAGGDPDTGIGFKSGVQQVKGFAGCSGADLLVAVIAGERLILLENEAADLIADGGQRALRGAAGSLLWTI